MKFNMGDIVEYIGNPRLIGKVATKENGEGKVNVIWYIKNTGNPGINTWYYSPEVLQKGNLDGCCDKLVDLLTGKKPDPLQKVISKIKRMDAKWEQQQKQKGHLKAMPPVKSVVVKTTKPSTQTTPIVLDVGITINLIQDYHQSLEERESNWERGNQLRFHLTANEWYHNHV